MSTPHAPDGIIYEPLPLTAPETPRDPTFNPPQPHSPSPQGNTSFPEEDGTFYPPQPRFLGESGQSRESYASSHNTHPSGGSETADSVYALGPGGGYRDDPRDSYHAAAQPDIVMSPVAPSRGAFGQEKRAAYAAPNSKSKRRVLIIAIVVALILIILAVIIPVYFAVVKPNQAQSGTKVVVDENGKTETVPEAEATAKPNPVVRAAVSGGSGSTVTMDDGSTFKYENNLGGNWYYDEFDPLNNGARPNDYTPRLNETWNYSTDKVLGVNLGGWLVLEPFISPALWERYIDDPVPPIDEYTLSVAMRADTARGGINQIEEHYKTFITEKDFAEIAAAGLNWVRIPIGYWAIEVLEGEPFLEGVSWTYFLKAVKWARKYGLRINLDFHGHAGSQNGWNHSGKFGTINILQGAMGMVNAERSLDYIRIFAEFISQPEYKDVVPMFGIMNEPRGQFIGELQLKQYYKRAYDVVRNAGGTGEGNGPWVVFHDGFLSVDKVWGGFLPNSDRVGLDTHQYIAFDATPHGDPMSMYEKTPCNRWGAMMNASMGAFGHTNAGEYSNAATDCGYWLNGVNLGTRYEGNYTDQPTERVGSCALYKDWNKWDAAMKASIKEFALSSMDAMRNYFFWTWKIGESTIYGKVQSPDWSYQLGLANGWMPLDPREADGACGNSNPWTPPLKPWQTGGAGAGNIAATVSQSLAWPPTSITLAGPPAAIPSFTATGKIKSLTAPPFTTTQTGISATITGTAGSGWHNAADTQLMMVAIPTCTYLDTWIGPTGAVPAPLCSAGAAAKREAEEESSQLRKKAFGRAPAATPVITPAPRS